MPTAIDLLLHRQRTCVNHPKLPLVLGERLFNTIALLLRCCMTSLASPDITGATGKEGDVLVCAQSTVTQLTSSLALQRNWSSEMLACLESILKDLHQSTAHLLTDDLLEAATTVAHGARAGTNPREVSESAQRLEDTIEDIRGKGPCKYQLRHVKSPL